MNVLFVSAGFPPEGRPLENIGGMQTVATELCDTLARQPGVTVTCLALRSSERWLQLRLSPFILSLLLRIPRMVRAHDIEVILFASLRVGWLAWLLKKRRKLRDVPMVSIAHGYDVVVPLPPYTRLLPRIFKALDFVLPISRATKAACLERGLDPHRARLVRNGVRPERFDGVGKTTDARRLLEQELSRHGREPLGRDAFLLCSVGRLVRRKGTLWFLENVLPRLPPNVYYWIGGQGPMVSELSAAIERTGLQDRVRLLGKLSDEEVAMLLRGSDLFVMPNIEVRNDMEGFGIVMLEAGVCGLPVVASRLEGIVDVVHECENGVLVTSGNADEWARAIERLRSDRELLQRLAARSGSFTRERFAWDVVVHDYLEALETACSVTQQTTP
jgi:phosphatidylinositol alpha-1,6-mannosyltransferase